MSTRFLLLFFLFIVTLLRWFFLSFSELSPESAYLALCGFQPSIANFDGPAATALFTSLGAEFVGSNALGTAFAWPVFAALTTFAFYLLAKPLVNSSAATALAVLLNLLPVFNHAALTPSSAMPLAMCSITYFALAWRAVITRSLLFWLASGLAAAAALLFTYNAWFLFPSLFAFLMVSRRWRSQWLSLGLWLSFLPSLFAFSLLVLWNAQNDWVHFIGGTLQSSLTLQWQAFPLAVVHALLALTPFVFFALAFAVYFAIKGFRSSPKLKFAIVPAFIATFAALYAVLQGREPIIPALTAAILLLPLLAFFPASVARICFSFVFVGTALWTSFSIALFPDPAPLISNDVAREIEALRVSESAHSQAPAFLIAENAPMASALAVLLKDTSFAPAGHPPVYVPESPFANSQYALWPRYDQFVDAPPQAASDAAPDPFTEQHGVNLFIGRSALFVSTQPPDQLPQAITAAFASWRQLAEINTPSGSILYIYLCSDYETLPL